MKAFEFYYNEDNFRYPDEMRKLVSGLEKLGKINIPPKRLEQLYMDYSEDYWCAGWLMVDEETIQSFASYLCDIDV